MSLHRLTQLNLSLVAVLGTLLLGAAQGSLALPIMALGSACAAFYWTDVRGTVRLNGALANLAALVAVAISVSEVVRAEPSEQLVAIANLLIYLQTILLFQEKTVRVGWQLLSLSLLQVVVAAAIGESILFGALVMLYLVCALSGVALVCCYGESLAQGTLFSLSDLRRKSSRGLAAHASSEGKAAKIASAEPPKHFYRALARCLCGLAVCSVVVAAAFFVLAPRHGEAKLMAQNIERNASTGFTDQIELNGSGRRIFENNEIVMRIKLIDEQTEEPFSYHGDIYLRGGVAYDYQDGNWQRARREELGALGTPRRGAGVVRQQIEIEPMRHDRLFSAYPAVTTYNDTRIAAAPLRRSGNDSRMEVAIGTTAFYRGEQHAATPAYSFPYDKAMRLPGTAAARSANPAPADTGTEGDGSEPALPDAEDNETRDDGSPLAGLIAWARTEIANAEIDPGDRIDVARTLEERLKLSGDFGYSLALPERMPEMDPIEDFITTHRQGNCEFFASALVLSLRSLGIPARIVMGYRSADWNPLGGYLQVRELHAHAWVEAYLKPAQVPEDMKLPGHDYRGGAWLRLDPTPNDESFAATDGNFGFWMRINNLFDHVDLLWRNYVVGFDRERQDRLVFSPLEELASAAKWAIAGGIDLFVKILLAIFLAIGWLGAFVSAVAVWLAMKAISQRWPGASPFGGLARLGGWFALPTWRRRATTGIGAKIAFYDRFERIAAQAGFRRPPCQTPLEFAKAIGGQLFDMPQGRIAARAPRQVVEAFYRVRYGGKSLGDEEAAAVEMALFELDRVLNGATH